MKLILYPLALILCFALNADAATYYVKQGDGNDANNCTAAQNEGTAKLTITSALSCFNPATAGSGAGHTIKIYAGVYTEALNNNIPGGTSWANPFTITKNAGDTVEIKPSSCSALIVIDVRRTNSKFFQIKGVSFADRLKITAGTGTCSNDAIKFALSSSLGAPSFGRLQYLEVTGALNHGIQFTSSSGNNEILDNWIHANGDQVNVDDTHGMYLHSPDNLIEGNLVEDNCNRGLQIFNSGTNNAHRNVVRRNIFRQNGTCETSSQVVLSSGNDIKFHDNFIYGGNQHAIGVNQNGPQRTLIFNNTMYDHAGASPCINIQAGANGTVIKNNICRNPSGSPTFVTDAGTGTIESSNLSTATNPVFIDAAAGNLCLQSTSPAINAGTATIATGTTRLFNGTAPDYGACETLPVTIATGIAASADTAQHVDITLPQNMGSSSSSTQRTPLLPATGITGFTLSNSRTITSAVRLSDSVVRLTYTGTCTSGTFSYSGGNLTDSALIGGSAVQPVFTITAQAITNNCGAPAAGTFTQVAYQWNLLRNDPTGSLTKLPTTSAPASSAITASTGSVFALEIQVNCDNVADCAPLGQILQFDIASSGSWTTITDTCGDVCFYGASDTSASVPSGVPMCPISGALTCVDGGTQRTAAAVPVIDLAQNNSTVNRYLIKVMPDVAEVFRLRLINQDGTVHGTYTVYPTFTGRTPTAGVGM